MTILLTFLPTASSAFESGQAADDDAFATESAIDAMPTQSQVYVDGVSVSFDAYNIAGSNYLKLRDLAYVLNGTAKQFAVSWDAAASIISIDIDQPYIPVGGEMSAKGIDIKQARPSDIYFSVDSHPLLMIAYNIDDNNYFKLRDLGQALDFSVDWHEETRTIHIETAPPAILEAKAAAPGAEPSAEEEYALEIVRLLNEERGKRGLTPLTADAGLCAAAQKRAQELQQSYSHKRPNGSSFYTVLQEFNIPFNGCAENIASGQSFPQEIMHEWMISTGHQENILGDYSSIGVGVVKRPEPHIGYYWAQLFIM